MDSAVSGVRSWCEASTAKSRSAVSSSLIRLAEPSSPSATRSSSGTPYLRPTGRASPEPSRSAAPASSSRGRVNRRACSRASPTATAIASSASEPIITSPLVTWPITIESSAATVTVKSLVRADPVIVSCAGGLRPAVARPPPRSTIVTYRSRHSLANPLMSGGSPSSKRSCRPVASAAASCFSWALASLLFRPATTKPSGTPSSSTAATATARVDTSRRRCTAQPPRPPSARPVRAADPRLSAMVLPSVTALEPEADPPDRGDEARAVRVVPQLAAQPGHVHVQGLRRPPPLAVPHLAHDLLTGDHLPGLGHQQREQIELLGGEVDLGLAQPGPPRIGVDPDALHDPALRSATAQQGPDPGQ